MTSITAYRSPDIRKNHETGLAADMTIALPYGYLAYAPMQAAFDPAHCGDHCGGDLSRMLARLGGVDRVTNSVPHAQEVYPLGPFCTSRILPVPASPHVQLAWWWRRNYP